MIISTVLTVVKNLIPRASILYHTSVAAVSAGAYICIFANKTILTVLSYKICTANYISKLSKDDLP